MREILDAGFSEEGVYYANDDDEQLCERLLGQTPPDMHRNKANSDRYVKQYLPVGCVVVRDEENALIVDYWFHGYPTYRLNIARDLVPKIPLLEI